MRLYHYSSEKIEKFEDRSYKDLVKLAMAHGWQKPLGVWVSCEPGYHWKRWCKEQKFNLEGLRYRYRIEIEEKAKILHLKTQEEIFEFTEKFKYYPHDDKGTNSIAFDYKKHALEAGLYIRWDLVKANYDGLIISPYQPSCALYCGGTPGRMSSWYYGWDCASGCLWDVKMIKSIRLMKK